MHEIPSKLPAEEIAHSERKESPTPNRSIFITATGVMAVDQIRGLIPVLSSSRNSQGIRASHLLIPVLPIAGVAKRDEDTLDYTLKEYISPHIWQIWSRKPRFKIYRNSGNAALADYLNRKDRDNDADKIALHLVQFDGSNTEVIKNTLKYFRENLTEFHHMTLIVIPDNVHGRYIHDKGQKEFGISEFGMPVMVVNLLSSPPKQEGEVFTAPEMFRICLATLIASPQFPRLLMQYAEDLALMDLSVRQRNFDDAASQDDLEGIVASNSLEVLSPTNTYPPLLNQADKKVEVIVITSPPDDLSSKSGKHVTLDMPQVDGRFLITGSNEALRGKGRHAIVVGHIGFFSSGSLKI